MARFVIFFAAVAFLLAMASAQYGSTAGGAGYNGYGNQPYGANGRSGYGADQYGQQYGQQYGSNRYPNYDANAYGAGSGYNAYGQGGGNQGF